MAFKPLFKSYGQTHFKHSAAKIEKKRKKGKARREKQKVQIIIRNKQKKKNDRCCAHKREGERHVEKRKKQK